MFAKLRKFDFYRHVPIDLTEPTAPGAIISIVCGIVMMSLFVGEVRSLFNPPLRSDMFVAQDQQGERLRINYNLTFHKLPCFLTSLDVVDALGRHEMGTPGEMTMTRVSSNGGNLGTYDRNHPGDTKFENMREEGCNLRGHVGVNKVPGNFHVSSHGLQHLVMQYANGGNINVQHTVHYLWIGDIEFHGDHGYEGEVHPLNGIKQLEDGSTHYEYHLDVVPTIYEDKGTTERSYQIAASMHKQGLPGGHMPAAFFRYQLSPITVRFHRDRTGLLHFTTYVCAIVGGVYTVAGLLNRVVHKTAVQLQRKLLGKDG